MSFLACAPFLYMEVFGLDIISYTLHQACAIAAFSFTSIFSGKISQRFGPRKSILNGIALCIFASFLLVGLGNFSTINSSPYLMTFFMMLFYVGFAICYPVIFSLSLEVFPENKGTASSAIMGMRALLVAIFTGLTSMLYNGHIIIIAYIILLAVTLGCIFSIYLLKSNLLSTQGFWKTKLENI